MKLSVVIPVYNEVKTLRDVLARVQAVPIDKELILVDDGSTDGTRDLLGEIARTEGLRVLFQPHNQGKGAALRTGFQAAGFQELGQAFNVMPPTRRTPRICG